MSNPEIRHHFVEPRVQLVVIDKIDRQRLSKFDQTMTESLPNRFDFKPPQKVCFEDQFEPLRKQKLTRVAEHGLAPT